MTPEQIAKIANNQGLSFIIAMLLIYFLYKGGNLILLTIKRKSEAKEEPKEYSIKGKHTRMRDKDELITFFDIEVKEVKKE